MEEEEEEGLAVKWVWKRREVLHTHTHTHTRLNVCVLISVSDVRDVRAVCPNSDNITSSHCSPPSREVVVVVADYLWVCVCVFWKAFMWKSKAFFPKKKKKKVRGSSSRLWSSSEGPELKANFIFLRSLAVCLFLFLCSFRFQSTNDFFFFAHQSTIAVFQFVFPPKHQTWRTRLITEYLIKTLFLFSGKDVTVSVWTKRWNCVKINPLTSPDRSKHADCVPTGCRHFYM